MTDRRFPPKIALPGSHLQRSLEKAGRFGGDGSFNSLVVALGVTIGDGLGVGGNATIEGTLYAGGLASLQTSDPLASVSATTPITLRAYGRQVVEHRTDSTTALDGPGMHFVRRSAAGGAAAANWLIGEFSFSGGYGSGDQTLVNAGIYAQAREAFTTYGTHGATDLVFATKAVGTGSNRAAEVLRILAEGHTVPHTDNVVDLGADATTGGTLRRWRSLRIGTDIRTDAGSGAGGILHWYLRSAAGVLRWGIGNTAVDTGSAGADLAIWRYSSSGTLLANWLTVTRSSGAWTITGNGNVTGTLAASSTVQGTQLISTVATGTAPLTVASTTLVTNLHADNSDKLGGTAAASYALLASPTLTGTPAAPTAAPGTNTTQLATTAFVQAATGALVTGVSSVFGRTGAVVATSGDYSFSLLSGIIDTAQVSGAYSGITGVGTLASGAVPANLVTPGTGTFGAGAYTFPSTLVVATNLTASGTNHTLGSNAGAGLTLAINGVSGNNRYIKWRSGGSDRWLMYVDATVESGSNAGSAWRLQAMDDSGVTIDTPIVIPRAAGGTMTLARPVSMSSTLTVTGTTTLNSNLTAKGGGNTFGADTNTGQTVVLNAAASTTRILSWRSASTVIWTLGTRNNTESGGNAGADFRLNAVDDTGVSIDFPFTIVRAAGGLMTLARPTLFTSTLRIGSGSPDTSIALGITTGKTLTGATTTYGILTQPLADSGVTSSHSVYAGIIRTVPASFTLTNAYGLQLLSPSLGAGSTVTNLRAIYIANHGVAGTTNTYALNIADQTGSTNNYAIYTATGLVRFGDAVTTTSSLTIAGALAGVTTGAFSGQITSTLATGTSPFSITSTTVNTNLNADLLDGQHGSYYNDLANATGTLGATLGGTAQSSWTLGDLLYASAANTLSKLAGNTTTTKKFLTQTGTGAVSAAPAWGTIGAADVAAGTFIGTFGFSTLQVSSGVLVASDSYVNGGVQPGGSSYGILPGPGISTTISIAATGLLGADNKAIHLSTPLTPGTGAYLDLWGVSHANAGRVDIGSGGTAEIRLLPGGSIAIGAAGSFGSGVKVIFIANATTDPTSNPTGGGILYVSGGALKYRGSSGTVTTLAAA